MKRSALFLAIILALATLSSRAATNVDPATFTIPIQVTSSELAPYSTSGVLQLLQVVIDGKRFQLTGNALNADVRIVGKLRPGLLPPGDYKARLVAHPPYKPDYLNFEQYELLLPDNRTMTLQITGIYN